MNTTSQTAKFSEAQVSEAIASAPETVTTVISTPDNSKKETVPERTVELVSMLQDNAKMQDVIKKVNELVQLVNKLQEVPPTNGASRDRGPVSEKQMTEDDARKIMLGEFSSATHKEAAQKLHLSYGQVYSARKGFTFKKIYNEAIKAGKKW